MKKSSLIKISFAMAVISLYTYIFGIMDIVEMPVALLHEEPPVSVEGGEDEPAILELDVANGRMPHIADFDAPIIPRRISAEIEEITAAATATRAVTTPSTRTTAANTAAAPPATTGITINNNDPPSSGTFRISSGGSTVEGDAFDVVSRVVQAEIGSAFHREAIKAQAVAVYTYIKRQNNTGNSPVLPISPNASERVRECVREVWGQAIYHNGDLIQAVFSASSAGWSSSARNVWGSDLPYLQSARREFDEQHDPNWGRTMTLTSDEIMTNVMRNTGIQLSGNPADWLKINNHVDTVYVGDMSIGGSTTFTRGGTETKITGRVFRERIMGFALRSASFTFRYDSTNDTFTFTTNGYGHGAGLSQNGANILATHHGYSYTQILTYYYVGVEVR
jgi:stage II sporulation protein D